MKVAVGDSRTFFVCCSISEAVATVNIAAALSDCQEKRFLVAQRCLRGFYKLAGGRSRSAASDGAHIPWCDAWGVGSRLPP